jgi:hypothetical protein
MMVFSPFPDTVYDEYVLSCKNLCLLRNNSELHELIGELRSQCMYDGIIEDSSICGLCSEFVLRNPTHNSFVNWIKSYGVF